jgi:hypothetical protein
MRKSHPVLVGIENVRPYKLTTSESLYTVKPPPMQIEGFLAAGGIMGITSYPGVGKTWVAMEVARTISSGTSFLGRKTIRGGVLFVGSDSSLDDYARQWTRLSKFTGLDYEPVRFLIQSPFMLESIDEIRKLIATHRSFKWGEVEVTSRGPEQSHGFSVIVFDTLSRLTRANQNDNNEMEDVFRNIRILSEATGAAIILLHHNSKKSEFNDGSDWRGAMSQIGALDSWVQLVPHKSKKHLIGIQFKKFRGITPPDFAYTMNVDEVDQATLVASEEPVTLAQRLLKDGVSEAVLAHIKAHPGLRAGEIRDALYEKFKSDFTEGKFNTCVRNRLTALGAAEHIEKYLSQYGKALYREAVKPQPDKAGAVAAG